jgi:hypothetical protein
MRRSTKSRWFVVFAIVSVGAFTYLFSATEWAAGLDPVGRCGDEMAPPRLSFKEVVSASVERVPPKTHCRTRDCNALQRGQSTFDTCVGRQHFESFSTDARLGDWLALIGYAGAYYGFFGTVILGVAATLIGRLIARYRRRLA